MAGSATFAVSTALAEHYHTYNNIEHGVVHGSSDRDGAFFSRTYGYYFGSINQCAVGDAVRGYYASGSSNNANLCSLYSFTYTATPDECQARSYNRSYASVGGGDYVGGHTHGPHSPPFGACRVVVS